MMSTFTATSFSHSQVSNVASKPSLSTQECYVSKAIQVLKFHLFTTVLQKEKIQNFDFNQSIRLLCSKAVLSQQSQMERDIFSYG
jgi:hypothetical protein